MVPCGLDPDAGRAFIMTLRSSFPTSRSSQRQISRLAQPMALGPHDRPGWTASILWRMVCFPVGHLSSHRLESSLDLARQLGHTHVGLAAISNRRHLRNSFWVAALTFGEGWHNNHHAHPQSCRHGLAWYEFDPNWYGICALRVMGLAWNVNARKLETAASASLQAR